MQDDKSTFGATPETTRRQHWGIADAAAPDGASTSTAQRCGTGEALVLREVGGQPNVFQQIGQVILANIPANHLEGEADAEPKVERLVLTLI